MYNLVIPKQYIICKIAEHKFIVSTVRGGGRELGTRNECTHIIIHHVVANYTTHINSHYSIPKEFSALCASMQKLKK